MAKKRPTKSPAPVAILPGVLRGIPALPTADAVLDIGLALSADEVDRIRLAMAIHSASKRPSLTWNGWKHIAVALAVGTKHALAAADGRNDTPIYRSVMGEFLRKSGLIFLNKDDRAKAVALLPRWEEIDAWRESLDKTRQVALNNPREVWEAFVADRRRLGDPEAKPRPSKKLRQFPSLLEQFEAVQMQLQLAEEKLEQAERESAYFAEMADAIARKAKLDANAIAEIRAKVRAEHEAAYSVDGPEE